MTYSVTNMQKTENFYLKALHWGIYLAVFTPLILYNQFISIFHFPKVLVFRTLVEIMLILFVLLILEKPSYRPNWKNPLLIAVSIFTGLYVLTSLTGLNPYRSFWGTLERMGGVFSFLHYWVFFVILISIFKNRSDWLKFLKLSVVAGFLSVLYAWGQYFDWQWFVGWQMTKLFGTMGNAALFAGYLIFIIFLALYFLLSKETSRNGRIFYGLVIILSVPALFLTAVRGSILSFLGAIFLLTLFILITSSNRRAKRGAVIFIIALIIFISVFWFSRYQPWVQENHYLQRITDISLQTKTVQTRLWAWQSAWQGWRERFILGWGPENFNLVFAKHFNPRFFEEFGSEDVWDRAHNVLLNTGTTMGLIGLLSYISIWILLLYYFIRALKNRTANRLTLGIFAAMLIAYLGHNMFIFDTFNSFLMLFAVLGFLNFLIIKPPVQDQKIETEERNSASKEKIKKYQKAALIISIPLIIFTVYRTAIVPVKANYAATRGIVYARFEEYYPKAFDYFRKSLNYNFVQGKYEIRHHLARAVFRMFSKGDDVEKFGVKEEDIVFAINEVYKNIETDSLDPIPYLYAARLNEFLSRIVEPEEAGKRLEEAERLIEKAGSLNDTNPYIYFELGQVRIFQGKFDQAIKFFDQGINLAPEAPYGYWYKGVTYLDIGEIEKGKENIAKAAELGYRGNISDIHRLLKIYVSLKDYPEIIKLYLRAIELEPDNVDHYTSLAAAYKENGQIDKAIEMARKAGEIDSNLKPEAEAFIRMLEAMRQQNNK